MQISPAPIQQPVTDGGGVFSPIWVSWISKLVGSLSELNVSGSSGTLILGAMTSGILNANQPTIGGLDSSVI